MVGVAMQFDSDDQPDTPGVYRTQSFDLSVFDIRKVPPDQIAVSDGERGRGGRGGAEEEGGAGEKGAE